ncbi:MAG: D-alanyl-D-alanine carboxypeptidase family protein, partial [Bacillota bacterium]
KHNLSPDYVPPDLTQPDIRFTFSENLPKKLMRKEAAEALTRLFEHASREGITLLGVSGYRSYQTQKEIFENKARLEGEVQANRTSARPGQSEHQTGLAMDIISPSISSLSTSFGATPEGKWVAQNAADFGFIIRYQRGKESITGYDYEPWHLRYVGVAAAKYIYQNGITLEEYLGDNY